jgi:hypothetical protein
MQDENAVKVTIKYPFQQLASKAVKCQPLGGKLVSRK